MDVSWPSMAARALARVARVYPLRQIALAATLFLPVTVALHALFSLFDVELIVENLVGPWAITLTGAGLAFLVALSWAGISNSVAAKKRRSQRAQHRKEVFERTQREREASRNIIRGLAIRDKAVLRSFVDRRRSRFESSDIGSQNSDLLQRLKALGILTQWYPYAVMDLAVFDLLLSEPDLVGSNSPPIARIVPAR